MNAVVLCAGFGTRLFPLTRHTAKPLLPVAGKPVVEHLLYSLTTRAVRRVALVANSRFYEDFLQWAAGVRHRVGELEIEVIDNGVRNVDERLGAVGDLLLALERTNPEGPVLVAAGDNLFRMNFDALWEDVASRNESVIVTYRESDLARLRRTGVAELGEGGRVVRVVEKPENPGSEWACPALYILAPPAHRSVATYVRETGRTDNLGELIAWLVDRHPVYAHRMQGERWDIGNLDNYAQAEAWLQAR